MSSAVYGEDVLNKLLDERIEANEQYRDDFTEEAKESKFADKLVPLEKKNGQEWVDYIKYVRASDDKKLKAYVLKTEIMGELISAYYDLEFAEGLLDKTTANTMVKKWKTKLEELEKAIEADAKEDK